MIRYIMTISFIFMALILNKSFAEDPIDEPLRLFKPFIGKTWKGKFKSPSADEPVFDVSRWERALNGTAIHILHSLNENQYRGESLIFWDSQREENISICVTAAFFVRREPSPLRRVNFLITNS